MESLLSYIYTYFMSIEALGKDQKEFNISPWREAIEENQYYTLQYAAQFIIKNWKNYQIEDLSFLGDWSLETKPIKQDNLIITLYSVLKAIKPDFDYLAVHPTLEDNAFLVEASPDSVGLSSSSARLDNIPHPTSVSDAAVKSNPFVGDIQRFPFPKEGSIIINHQYLLELDHRVNTIHFDNEDQIELVQDIYDAFRLALIERDMLISSRKNNE